MATINQLLLARFRTALANHAARAAALTTTAWSNLDGYDQEHVASYVATLAAPLTGIKAATVATATAFYATHLATAPAGIEPADVATVARLRDPFTATWRALADGHPYPDAIVRGRSAAAAVADNFVTATARRTGDAFAARTGLSLRWERVAEPGACDWCHRHDGLIFWTADDADFGHTRCHCDVVPTTSLTSTRRESATDRAERERRQQQAQLRAQIRAAEARQEQAAIDQLTEADPARRERLSTREQEWETRAERLREQLARL